MAENDLTRTCELLVIGGSAGAFDVILQVLPNLKDSISFPIIIVLHRKNSFDITLSELLSFKTSLRVREAEEKEQLQPATIYLAPPDYHLLIERDRTLALDASEKVHYSRPSIDVTFQSAADIFKKQLVCLLLSGANTDGTDGLIAVKSAGGIAVVQDPATADVSYMPHNAIESLQVDHILKINEIAAFINAL